MTIMCAIEVKMALHHRPTTNPKSAPIQTARTSTSFISVELVSLSAQSVTRPSRGDSFSWFIGGPRDSGASGPRTPTMYFH